MKNYIVVMFLFLLSIVSVVAQSTDKTASTAKQGKLIKKSNLVKHPSNQEDVMKVINVDDNVLVYERERAWYKVSTDDHIMGWLKMLNVRFVGTSKRAGEYGVKSLVSSVSNSLPTVSTGVRGFDEEDLKNAQANFEQVALLTSFIPASNSVDDFVKKGELHAESIKVRSE